MFLLHRLLAEDDSRHIRSSSAACPGSALHAHDWQAQSFCSGVTNSLIQSRYAGAGTGMPCTGNGEDLLLTGGIDPGMHGDSARVGFD